METQTKNLKSNQKNFAPTLLGAGLRQASEARRLASVPKSSQPLFTREQKQFLGESLILIGGAIALLFLFLSPGSSHASVGGETEVANRIRAIQEERNDEAKRKSTAIQVAGTLGCTKATTGKNRNSEGCARITLNEFNTGKQYVLRNADLAENLMNEGVLRVRVTGNSASGTKTRTVASNTTTNAGVATNEAENMIDVTQIEKME
jgi:hypothetical protein